MPANRRFLTRATAAAAFFWTLCVPLAGLAAQSDGPARCERANDCRKRWEKLPAEEKEHLKERFTDFKKLSPREQKELRRRHEQLLRLRERIESEWSKELQNLPAPEQQSFVDAKVRLELEKLKGELSKKRNAAEGRGRRDGGGMCMRLAEDTAALARLTLKQLRDDGWVSEQEFHRIASLPHAERIDEVLSLRKEVMLSALDGPLPSDELARYRDMPVRRFHREMCEQRRSQGLWGPFARLSNLTLEQETALAAIRDENERGKARERFFDQNLRHRLADLGIDLAAIDAILAQPPYRRIELIKEALKALPPEKIPPGLRGAPARTDGPGESGSRTKAPRRDGHDAKLAREPGPQSNRQTPREFFHAAPKQD